MARLALVVCMKRHVLAELTSLPHGDVVSWRLARPTVMEGGDHRWVSHSEEATAVTKPVDDFEVDGKQDRTLFTLQCKVCKRSYNVDLSRALSEFRQTGKPLEVRPFAQSNPVRTRRVAE